MANLLAEASQNKPVNLLAELSQKQPETEQDSSVFQDIGSGLETAATMITGAIAEPIAGFSGIYEQATGGDATKAIEETRQSLTYEGGEGSKEQLKSIGEFVAPAVEKLGEAEKYLGEKTLELTGSPELAAIAHTLPTAILETLGLKGIGRTKSISKGVTKDPKKLLSQVAPKKEDLKTFSRSVYKELDDNGAKVKPMAFDSLSKTISTDLKKQGYNKRVHPKLRGVIDELDDMEGAAPTIGELDTLRKVARGAAKSTEPDEVRLASRVIDKIDSFMDNLDDQSLTKSSNINIGEKYKQARSTWSKAKKLEDVEDIMHKAEFSASGFENGIRMGFTQLLKNKKKLKGFSPEEIKVMSDISKGSFGGNLAKQIGKLGFGEGKATSLIGTSIGATAGLAAFGGVGAIAVPIIGQVSRNLSQVLTKNKSALLNDVIGAGNNAKEIVKAYTKNVPRAAQSERTLAELLLKTDITVSDIENLANLSARRKEDLLMYMNAAKKAGQAVVVGSKGAEESLNQE